MELQELICKMQNGEVLTQEEREQMITGLETELRSMRERDPRGYLSLLNIFIDAVKKCSAQLASS